MDDKKGNVFTLSNHVFEVDQGTLSKKIDIVIYRGDATKIAFISTLYPQYIYDAHQYKFMFNISITYIFDGWVIIFSATECTPPSTTLKLKWSVRARCGKRVKNACN